MTIQDKIFTNIKDQMVVGMMSDDLNTQLEKLTSQRERLSGAMEVLAEMFQEATGKDLQREINTDPDWKALVQKAQETAKAQIASPMPTMPTEQPDDGVSGGTLKPQLRRVDSNKRAPVPVEATPAEVAQTEEVPDVEPTVEPVRSRDAVKVSIDDDPPGPGTPDPD